jgi:hypothetical protein
MIMATDEATEKVKFCRRVLSSIYGTAIYHVTSVDRTRDKKLQGYYKTCGLSEKGGRKDWWQTYIILDIWRI